MIRVVLVDDHTMLLAGLRRLLDRESDIDVVGDAGDGLQAQQVCRETRPDVVLMDVGMPDHNGIEATRAIVGEGLATHVVALSVHADRRYVTSLLEAGASGYVLKDAAATDVVQALRAVSAGQTYLSPGVSDFIVEGYLRDAKDRDDGTVEELSERERIVLQMVAEGRTTREIAEALSVTEKTVETHRRNVMTKLGLHSIAELTRYAVEHGLTTLED